MPTSLRAMKLPEQIKFPNPKVTDMSSPGKIRFVLYLMQFVAAGIVTGIMGYFVYLFKSLNDENCVPEQFYLLLAAALATMVKLITLTFGSYSNWSTNGVFCLLWIAALVLFAIRTPGAFTSSCTRNTAISSGGVTLCQLYKTVIACSFGAIFATFAAFIADIYIRKHTSFEYREAAKEPLRRGRRSVPDIIFERRSSSPYDTQYKGGAAAREASRSRSRSRRDSSAHGQGLMREISHGEA